VAHAVMATAAGSVLASGDGGFEAPKFSVFSPEPFLFKGTPFEINQIIFVRLVATLAFVVVFTLYAKRARLVPGRAQGVVESMLEFSKRQVGEEILGERAKPYQPLLATVFLGLLFMNITGVIPGLQIASTSIVGMPLVYALVAYVGFIYAGIKANGFGRFFKEQLFPPGVPKPIYILMTPIELLSTFVIRPVTLTIRLLANMISGHLLLLLCFVGTHYLYLSLSGGLGISLGSLTLLAGIVFTLFEAFVAALQAYIFALLTAAYISLSIEH
jgi:ATP synthase F0, A subunit